jgi:hypothetical protein
MATHGGGSPSHWETRWRAARGDRFHHPTFSGRGDFLPLTPLAAAEQSMPAMLALVQAACLLGLAASAPQFLPVGQVTSAWTGGSPASRTPLTVQR